MRTAWKVIVNAAVGRLEVHDGTGLLVAGCAFHVASNEVVMRFRRDRLAGLSEWFDAGVCHLRKHFGLPIRIALGRPVAAHEARILHGAGFRPDGAYGSYQRLLASLPEPRMHGLQRRSLFDAGPEGLMLLHAATRHRAVYREMAPAQVLDALVVAAGEAPAESLWSVFYQGATPVGLALPSGGVVAGLMAFGVAPEHRGRGVGALIHASALHLLQQAGALYYLDQVASDNAPMRRIMWRHRCVKIASYREFLGPEPGVAT